MQRESDGEARDIAFLILFLILLLILDEAHQP
jgi:hypothetical protein